MACSTSQEETPWLSGPIVLSATKTATIARVRSRADPTAVEPLSENALAATRRLPVKTGPDATMGPVMTGRPEAEALEAVASSRVMVLLRRTGHGVRGTRLALIALVVMETGRGSVTVFRPATGRVVKETGRGSVMVLRPATARVVTETAPGSPVRHRPGIALAGTESDLVGMASEHPAPRELAKKAFAFAVRMTTPRRGTMIRESQRMLRGASSTRVPVSS